MIGKKINQLATELAPESTDLTIIGDPTTGVSKKITIAQLGAIFSGAVSFYTNLAAFPVTGDINVIYCAKDTQKLYLWSGSAYVEVFPSQALLDTYQLRSEKGNANGYASLDSLGKVPISQLPSSIMEYKGTWNAATNTPTLANGTGDTGDVYICNVAGTVNFGAGPITFAVGDYVIYSGTIWQRSSGAVGTVTSVAASITGDSVTISGSPVTTSGTLAFAFAGNSTQYINGAGNLVTFPGVINEAQNLITEVYNKTGATLTKGTVVYINGGQGNLPTITKAIATGDSTSAQTYGIVRNDITNNNNGYVVVAGRISDLDTQAFTEGTQLYLSSTTAGTYTSTKQYAPNHLVYVGIVVRAHPTQGVIEVKIQNGYEMDELHNVAAQSPSNNDGIFWEASTSLWKNKSIATVLGYTPQAQLTLTTTGSSGDATLVGATLNIPNYTLAGLGGVPTSRTLTINGTTFDLSANRTWSVGTVTSVGALTIGTSGTDLSSTVANGTTTPVITLNVPTASATNRGALSSTDWTTFNNKQNALTNPVTGTGTTNYLPKFTGASTIGNSNLINDASGNLGLGVTPSAWDTVTGFQVGRASIYGYAANDGGFQMNTYYGNSAFRYIANGTAEQIRFEDGAIKFRQAPSGTAGNAISFTQAMTLNASGNLSIGNTNDTYKLDVTGTGRFTSNLYTSTALYIGTTAAYGFKINSEGNSGFYNRGGSTSSHYPFLLENSSGSLLFQVQGNGVATFSSSVIAYGPANDWGLSIWGSTTTGQSYGGIVRGGTNSSDVAFKVNNAANTIPYFNIRGDGNVGIGTADPGAQLQVAGTVEANGSLYRAVFGTTVQDADMTGLTGGNGSELQIQSASTTRGAFLTLGGGMAFGEAMGGIAFYNSNNVDGKRCRAFIVGGQEGATAGEQGSYLSFGTVANTVSVPSERLRITSGGNVEINTGSIKTGEPDTGYGRAAIKIGARNTGEAFNSGGHLPVNIDGTIYYINLYSSLP